MLISASEKEKKKREIFKGVNELTLDLNLRDGI